jgi:hypothetical protein
MGDRKKWQDMVEEEKIEEAATFASTTPATDESRIEIDMAHQQSTDDDSMAFVDRMELADDEGETVLNGLSGEGMRESDERLVIDDTAIESVDGHANTRSGEWEKMLTNDSRVRTNLNKRAPFSSIRSGKHETRYCVSAG